MSTTRTNTSAGAGGTSCTKTSKSLDRRSVRTYHYDELKWVVVKYFDGQLSGVLKGTDVEHEESGETLQEGVLEEGDRCMAKWTDGRYQGKVVLVQANKDAAFKQLGQLRKALNQPTCSPRKSPQKRKPTAKLKTASVKTNEAKVQKKEIKDKAKLQKETKDEAKLQKKQPAKKKAEATKIKEAQIAAHEIMVNRLINEQLGGKDNTDITDQPSTSTASVVSNSVPVSGIYGYHMRQLLDIDMENETYNNAQEATWMENDNRQEPLNIGVIQEALEEEQKINGELRNQLVAKDKEIRQLKELALAAEHCVCSKLNAHLTPSTRNFIDFLYMSCGSAKTQAKGSQAKPPTTVSATELTSVPEPATLPKTTSDIPSQPCDPEKVDIGGVTMKKVVRDVCISSAKGSPAKLVRNLLQAFFTEDILAGSSAEGNRDRPGLTAHIVKAIKEFVQSKCPKFTEREINQIINCQCADTRKKLKVKAKSTQS